MFWRTLLAIVLLATPGPNAMPSSFVPPPILMYHRVDDRSPGDRVSNDLTVTPRRFREQLAYLRKSGITGISMAELCRRLLSGEPLDHLVVITFDDGYQDQYTQAAPILREFGDSATFYIITGELGRNEHLDVRELRDMSAQRLDISAHGVAHDDLSLMNAMQQSQQIDDSIAALRSDLGQPIDSYAYPSGRFDRTTMQLVKAAGVMLAVTTDPKYVIAPENRFELPRIRVHGGWRLKDFAQALQSAFVNSAIVLR